MTGRPLIINFLIVLMALIFILRLFYIQIIEEDYKVDAENNVIQKITQYPFRGLIYDNNDNLITFNSPVYDLMVVPQEVNIIDTARFCKLLEITTEEFQGQISKAKRYSKILPSKFQ